MDSNPLDLSSPAVSNTARQLVRVRHDTRRRVLTVSAVEPLTPHMRRIHLQSAEMEGFVSLGFDDHIKLFFPRADGSEAKRDYTPRRFDVEAGLMTIDFALHDAGPATAWAMAAQPGDTLAIGGPRGSVVIPDAFDWRLYIGDETALPAIGRAVEEASPGSPVVIMACVDQQADVQTFETAAALTQVWLTRDTLGADDLANVRQALDRVFPQVGAGFVWIAGESQFARALRAHVNEALGQPIEWIKASGYWVRGEASDD